MSTTRRGHHPALWLLLGAVGVGLLACCGGGAGVLVYLRTREPPERTIVGRWRVDREASADNRLLRDVPGEVRLEVRADRTYRLTYDRTDEAGAYAVTGRTGQTLKLTLTPRAPGEGPHEIFVEVQDHDRLYVDHRRLSGFVMTREGGPDDGER